MDNATAMGPMNLFWMIGTAFDSMPIWLKIPFVTTTGAYFVWQMALLVKGEAEK